MDGASQQGLWPFETPQAPSTEPEGVHQGDLPIKYPSWIPRPAPFVEGLFLLARRSCPVFVFLSGSLYSTTPNAPLFLTAQACFYEIKQARRSPAHPNFKSSIKSSSQGTRPAAQPDGGWQKGRVPALPLNTAIVWSAVQIYPALSTHSDQTPRQDSNQYQTIVSKHSIEPRVWQRLKSFQENKVSCQTSVWNVHHCGQPANICVFSLS